MGCREKNRLTSRWTGREICHPLFHFQSTWHSWACAWPKPGASGRSPLVSHGMQRFDYWRHELLQRDVMWSGRELEPGRELGVESRYFDNGIQSSQAPCFSLCQKPAALHLKWKGSKTDMDMYGTTFNDGMWRLAIRHIVIMLLLLRKKVNGYI